MCMQVRFSEYSTYCQCGTCIYLYACVNMVHMSMIPPPSQTGPKGVLTDFYRNQQDTQRKAVLEEKKRRELIQKHSATVQSKV